MEGLNDSLTNVGFVVVALFALAWLVSIVLYRRIVVHGRRRLVADALDYSDAAETA